MMDRYKTNLRECEGCKSKGSCGLKPYFIDNQGNKRVCPCQICLVKGICVSSCDKIKTYYYSFKWVSKR